MLSNLIGRAVFCSQSRFISRFLTGRTLYVGIDRNTFCLYLSNIIRINWRHHLNTHLALIYLAYQGEDGFECLFTGFVATIDVCPIQDLAVESAEYWFVAKKCGTLIPTYVILADSLSRAQTESNLLPSSILEAEPSSSRSCWLFIFSVQSEPKHRTVVETLSLSHISSTRACYMSPCM